MLYFTNSIGAAVGALASAFLLLGWIGMPGTMRVAGALNLALAAAVLAHRAARRAAAARGRRPPPATAPPAPTSCACSSPPPSSPGSPRSSTRSLDQDALARARLLVPGVRADALGVHHRARARRIVDPPANRPHRRSGPLQRRRCNCHGAGGARHLFVYHWTFDWMAWALRVLQRSEERLPLVQPLQPRHRVRRDAAGDLPRRDDPAAVHARAAARRARRARDRPGLLRQYARLRSRACSSPCTC